MKEKKVDIDGVEYTVTLDNSVLYVENVVQISLAEKFRVKKLDKLYAEYNFEFAPNFLEFDFPFGYKKGKLMVKEQVELIQELFEVSLRTRTPIEPDNLYEIFERIFPDLPGVKI